MRLTMKRTNTAELKTRRAALTQRLVDGYSSVEGRPITRRDLRDLASMGCLTVDERQIYDELRRVEMMLDIDD